MIFKKARYQKCVLDHQERVYRYARYTLRIESDAEDVTQEVFIKLWHHFDRIQPLKVKSWLLRTAHNQCIDLIRKRRRTSDRHVEIQDYQDYLHLGELASSEPDAPWDRMEKQSLGKAIESAVALLPDRLRPIFLMHEVQGMKYREIADALEMPLNTVKVHLLRARRLLQQHLSHENTP
jgi:RNA polymerase sigma-70 factor (ECF subfamily)